MESLRALVASFRSRPAWAKTLAAAAFVAAAGLGWSLLAPPAPAWVRIAPADEDRARVEAALDGASIAHDLRPDGLYVAEADRERAVAHIAPNPDAIGEALAQGGIFANPQQVEQQLHHALETELARMIAKMEPVRSATVRIVAASERRRIGFAGGEATAAVQVDLKPDAEFSEAHARAVAEMVAASVKGLKAEAVKLSDTKGRCYGIAESSADAARSLDLRERERRFARTLEAQVEALFPGARRVISVRLATPRPDLREEPSPGIRKGSAEDPSPVAAPVATVQGDVIEHLSVSVIIAVRDAAFAAPKDREDYARAAVAQLRHATGLDRDDYFRVVLQSVAEPAVQAAGTARTGLLRSLEGIETAWIGIVAAIALVPLAWIAWRRRRLGVVPPAPEPAPTGLQVPVEEALPAGPFDGIGRLSVDRTVMLLGDEHPQTIALVLNHLTTRRAGEILERIPTALQVDVVRRMTMLQAPTPEIVADVERALDRKLSIQRAQATRRTGSPEQVARILDSVNRDTGTRILLGVRAQDPVLAEELRRTGPERDA